MIESLNMLTAIRRVISDSSDVGKSNKKAKTMNSQAGAAAATDTTSAPMEGVEQTMPGGSPDSHVVEPDPRNNDPAPLRMVQPEHYGSNSSLSDGSEHEEDEGLVPAITRHAPKRSPEAREQIVPRQIQRVDRSVLNRMDSAADGSSSGSQRASSQNSSRDWGWFEDVHQSSDGLNQSEKRDAKKMNRPAQAPDIAPPENTHGKDWWSKNELLDFFCSIDDCSYYAVLIVFFILFAVAQIIPWRLLPRPMFWRNR